jgi:hypothetical protein
VPVVQLVEGQPGPSPVSQRHEAADAMVTDDAQVILFEPIQCRFRAGFDTERGAAAGARPGWTPYLCPTHGRWHLTKAEPE